MSPGNHQTEHLEVPKEPQNFFFSFSFSIYLYIYILLNPTWRLSWLVVHQVSGSQPRLTWLYKSVQHTAHLSTPINPLEMVTCYSVALSTLLRCLLTKEGFPHGLLLEERVERPWPQSRQPVEGPALFYRMAQKNFFSLNGFSEAGTGDSSGSSLAWASQ